MNPETYVGYDRLQYLEPLTASSENAPATYHIPATLPLGAFGLSGTWTEHAQEATAGSGAELELRLPGQGRLPGARRLRHPHGLGQRPQTKTVDVGGVPRLYTLYQARRRRRRHPAPHASPGIEAYDFTFG